MGCTSQTGGCKARKHEAAQGELPEEDLGNLMGNLGLPLHAV